MMELLDLHIGYGKKVLVKNISTNLDRGQLIGIIGKNGTGKSTLIKTLVGLHQSITGEVKIDGKKLADLTNKERSQLISYVPSTTPDFGYFKLEDLLAMGRYPYSSWNGRLNNEDVKLIDGIVNKMNLSDMKRKYLYAMSDGERQKSMIARALVQDTPIVVLDEPTAFLDPVASIEVLEVLKNEVEKNNKTVILSSHDLASCTEFSDLLWMIDSYQNLIQGSPSQLIENGQLETVFGKEGYGLRRDKLGFSPLGAG